MASVFIQTYGCSANIAESEMMAGLLGRAGFKLVNEPGRADVLVLNICTVKGNNTALREIRKLKERFPSKTFVITGCIVPEIIQPIRTLIPKAALVSTHNIDRVVQALKNALKSKTVEELDRRKIVKLMFPRKRKNPVIGIIPISSGCLDACAYCSTKLVKGVLHSYPPEKIIEEARLAVNNGCRELWITAQDTGCYGLDLGTNLAKLLQQIAEVPGEFFVRVGMGNPHHFAKCLDELIKVFKNPKIFKFLHIPVQSGNDAVLKAMRRNYTVKTFKGLVAKFRQAVPELTLSTDIIVGYPGETKEQFMDSVNLIKEIKPGVLNISRFIPREGTLAASLPGQIDGGQKKERSRTLRKEFDRIALEENMKWVGWKGEVLIDERGRQGTVIGRNHAYKPIVVKGNLPLGTRLKVKVVQARTNFLIGEKI